MKTGENLIYVLVDASYADYLCDAGQRLLGGWVSIYRRSFDLTRESEDELARKMGRSLLHLLQQCGITEQDLWMGTRSFLSAITPHQEELSTLRCSISGIICFLIPHVVQEATQVSKKSFKVHNDLNIDQLLRLICKRLDLRPERYALVTQSSVPVPTDSVNTDLE